jgi:hypothetical protein
VIPTEHSVSLLDAPVNNRVNNRERMLSTDATNDDGPELSARGHSENLERETGFEPATLSLGM